MGERGRELVGRFWEDVGRILRAVAAEAATADDPHESPGGREESRTGRRGRRPRILFLEWLDPPYDAGHWIPDMIECDSALTPPPPPPAGGGRRRRRRMDAQEVGPARVGEDIRFPIRTRWSWDAAGSTSAGTVADALAARDLLRPAARVRE